MAEQMKKKAPERRCTGCGEHFAKSALIRIVRSPDGEISLDESGKKNGRGAYLCRNTACLQKARRSRRLETNLETIIPDTVYESLERELAKSV